LRPSLLLHIFILSHFFGVLENKTLMKPTLWGDFHLFINRVKKLVTPLGIHDSHSNRCTGVVRKSVTPSSITRGMANPKVEKASTTTDGTGVLAKNVINGAMDD
jgi:hypothetical protein